MRRVSDPYRSRRSGRVLLLAAVLGVAAGRAPLEAQAGGEADRQAVIATLERLFEGMRTNDGEMVRSVFADGAVLISTEGRDGQPATRINPATGFVDAVANATGEWDEPFWDPVIQIQDHIATVWTKYAFYLDGEFSHCGVDALILARGSDGWKIAALGDSRERENCELPPGR
jgi:hypothetical protein